MLSSPGKQSESARVSERAVNKDVLLQGAFTRQSSHSPANQKAAPHLHAGRGGVKKRNRRKEQSNLIRHCDVSANRDWCLSADSAGHINKTRRLNDFQQQLYATNIFKKMNTGTCC